MSQKGENKEKQDGTQDFVHTKRALSLAPYGVSKLDCILCFQRSLV